jgi:hypothetical protein
VEERQLPNLEGFRFNMNGDEESFIAEIDEPPDAPM